VKNSVKEEERIYFRVKNSFAMCFGWFKLAFIVIVMDREQIQ
jgi:hypothetical protein